MTDQVAKEKTEAEQRFRDAFKQFVEQGMSPNEAAANALKILQEDHNKDNQVEDMNSVVHQTPAPPPDTPLDTEMEGPKAVTSFREIIEIAKVAKEAESFTELIRTIGKVFSDPDMLTLAAQPGRSDLKDDLISIQTLEALYSTLREGTSEGVQNSLKNALKVMASTLERESFMNHSREPKRLIPYLVAFEFPDIQYGDPDLQGTMFSLCKGFVRLPQPVLEEYITWLTLQNGDYFIGMLESLQMFVTVKMFQRNITSFRDVGPAVKVMSLLNHVNNKMGFVPFEEFYNAAVSEEATENNMFLLDDYRVWHSDLLKAKEQRDTVAILAERSAQIQAALDQASQTNTEDEAQTQEDGNTSNLDSGSAIQAKSSATSDQKSDSILPSLNVSDSFCSFPFILDPGSKAHVLRLDAIETQREEYRNARMGMDIPYLVLKVRRDDIVNDALDMIGQYPRSFLKKPLKVKFVGEEGIDEGGVQKEFFLLMTRQLLDPNFSMFVSDDTSRTIWFNPNTFEGTLKFEFVGTLLGLAIYNGIILDVNFPSVLYKKLLGLEVNLDDLKSAFPELGDGLQKLLDFEPKEQVEEVFSMTFQVNVEMFGEIKQNELIPGGSSIPVTGENREDYVSKYVEYRLTKSVAEQFDAFYKGFHMVCGGETLDMFKPSELELLICGSETLNFEELERTTRYDGFAATDELVRNFWTVVHEFDNEQKKKLLMFVTGSDRVPIRGLAALRLTITRNGPDSDRLPQSHTCFNTLLLPVYSSLDKLRDRLCKALEIGSEGFGSM